ncbi:MAG TPA: class I SAM-dependent methyltransferase [Acidobacteriaceae bacterium]|jgi:SAM-dependent methyltransferase|nr:class I SAM-dependent methyltransferase [Acidobacteriaceae bacterium]
MTDMANGYEEHAADFMRRRHPHIGHKMAREWAREFAPGATVLDLGCGDGVISEALVEAGLALYAVDASPTLLRAFCERFPTVQTECAAAEESSYFDRTFDGAIAVGLIFLLPEDAQRIVLSKVANALKRGGRFLFTAPRQACSWVDELTKEESQSLGAEVYEGLLRGLGFEVSHGRVDEGENHYFFAVKR